MDKGSINTKQQFYVKYKLKTQKHDVIEECENLEQAFEMIDTLKKVPFIEYATLLEEIKKY